MRIVIFSDVYGNFQTTKAIFDDINKNSIDEIIYFGDIRIIILSLNKKQLIV